jgi:hypothetical protein
VVSLGSQGCGKTRLMTKASVKRYYRLGVVGHTHNPSIWEAEATLSPKQKGIMDGLVLKDTGCQDIYELCEYPLKMILGLAA